MSKKRYVDTKFWDDNYIIEKDPVEKLLFLYLLTNTLTNIIGIYEISINRIAFDTGIDKDMVIKILERFEADDKTKYENGWIAIKNFTRHQLNNPKINAGIKALSSEVPGNLIKWSNIDYKKLNIIVDNSPKKQENIDYDRLSHPNLNLNTNLNTNLNLNSKEDTLLKKTSKEKLPANNIEFDFELWSWHGIDEDIKDRWAKIFPNIDIEIELNKIREYFKKHPGHEKMIREKFNNNYANYIFDWLARAEKYIKDKGN